MTECSANSLLGSSPVSAYTANGHDIFWKQRLSGNGDRTLAAVHTPTGQVIKTRGMPK